MSIIFLFRPVTGTYTAPTAAVHFGLCLDREGTLARAGSLYEGSTQTPARIG